jgi:hypothetical protein
MADSSLPLGFFTPTRPGLLLLHSLVEQALLGHSIVHHQHSAVMSKRNSFRHMAFMSTWNACIFLFIFLSMKDIGCDPIKYIKKIDEFYFSKKLVTLVELIHLENHKLIKLILIFLV